MNTNGEVVTKEKAVQEDVEQEEKKDPVVKVRISSDKLQAFATVEISENCNKMTPAKLIKSLKDQEITQGINVQEILRRCKTQSFFNEFQCAQGVEPKDGTDGSVEFLFEKDPVPKPKVSVEGKTDFHDMGIVQNVEKEQVLCTRVLPAPGENGINVFGDEIPFKPGKEYKFESGKNTVISEDTLELKAGIAGHVFYKNRKVEVNDTYTIRGNIDNSTGDIVSYGNVIVSGDVCEGFKIHAKGNVTINGLAEGATIWAEGNIKISQGMNGMDIGKIYCGGNVISKFFQNSEVLCAGDVSAEYYLNGSVTAGGNIEANGNRGMMLGGHYTAGDSIVAKTIGADSYLSTKVSIIINKEGFWNPELKKSDEEIEAELAKLSEEEREEWMKENVYVASKAPEHAKVVARGTAYPGVNITIGQCTTKLAYEYDNVRFAVNKEEGCIGNAPA